MNSFDEESRRCALLFESNDYGTVTSTNNTAGEGGNIVYAYPIYNCYNDYLQDVIRTTSYYIQRFTGGMNYSSDNDLLPISSRARYLKCKTYKLGCILVKQPQHKSALLMKLVILFCQK